MTLVEAGSSLGKRPALALRIEHDHMSSPLASRGRGAI